MAKIKIELATAETYPKCPHCEAELSSIGKTEILRKMPLEQHVIYSCPNCRKVLSIGYNFGM